MGMILLWHCTLQGIVPLENEAPSEASMEAFQEHDKIHNQGAAEKNSTPAHLVMTLRSFVAKDALETSPH